MRYKFIILLIAVFFTGTVFSNERDPKDTVRNFSTFKRSLAISGLLQMRYVASMTDSVDIYGKNFTGEGITNSFQLKRVRVMVKTNINDHFDANILMNLAEFSGTVQNKVLENAFIRYHYTFALLCRGI
jgi:hypothetical protein